MGYTLLRDPLVPSQGPGKVLCDRFQGWYPDRSGRASGLDSGGPECGYRRKRHGPSWPQASSIEGRSERYLVGKRQWELAHYVRFEGKDAADVDYEDYH